MPDLKVIKRNGEVKAMPIATHDRKAVMQQIDAHTREGSHAAQHASF